MAKAQHSPMAKGLPPEGFGHRKIGEAVAGKAGIHSELGVMEFFLSLMISTRSAFCDACFRSLGGKTTERLIP
jgi:hypothetical protein